MLRFHASCPACFSTSLEDLAGADLATTMRSKTTREGASLMRLLLPVNDITCNNARFVVTDDVSCMVRSAYMARTDCSSPRRLFSCPTSEILPTVVRKHTRLSRIRLEDHIKRELFHTDCTFVYAGKFTPTVCAVYSVADGHVESFKVSSMRECA
jgi:hypothetical protein